MSPTRKDGRAILECLGRVNNRAGQTITSRSIASRRVGEKSRVVPEETAGSRTGLRLAIEHGSTCVSPSRVSLVSFARNELAPDGATRVERNAT